MSAQLLDASPIFPTRGHHAPVSSELNASFIHLDKPVGRHVLDLPSTRRLLTYGGDARIMCGPSGSNQYGCASSPDSEVLAYGSSTASTISPLGFAAADRVRDRLKYGALVEEPHVQYERELDRVRRELTSLCGLEELSGLEIIFGASGTDLHLFASQLIMTTCEPRSLIVRIEATETGRGVPDALAGRHFSDCSALGDAVVPNSPLDCGQPVDIFEVKCRTVDGTLRPVAAMDAEVEATVLEAAAAGRRILITTVDVSKTGLMAPSPACIDGLRRRFPQLIEVLVDACQFRLSSATLRAYLEHDFLVAITGSKFVTGPTFCGALFVPANAARRLKTQTLPHALKSYSAQADWPRHWAATRELNPVANFGLLLRWEAALAELRAFRQLPDGAIAHFLEAFSKAVTGHLSRHPTFEFLPVPNLDRSSIAPGESWDRFSTIFSFLLMSRPASGSQTWLSQDETKRVHELLRKSHCHLGQPVACGTRDGFPVSALRLCASTRLIVDALSPTGRGSHAVIAEALAVLDKVALLATRLSPA